MASTTTALQRMIGCSHCSGRVASLNLRERARAKALRQFTQSIVAASMPTRLSTSSPRLQALGHKPSHCSDSHDLTWTHRWHLAWRSSSSDSIRLAACPLETFDPVSKACTTTTSDGALDGEQKPSTVTTGKTTETTLACCAQRAVVHAGNGSI